MKIEFKTISFSRNKKKLSLSSKKEPSKQKIEKKTDNNVDKNKSNHNVFLLVQFKDRHLKHFDNDR